MKRRNSAQWVVEPGSRLTINQKIGGALYDFIQDYQLTLSDGSQKLLLSSIREETGMNDTTLRRVFLGKTNNIDHLYRVMAAIGEWLPEAEYDKMENMLTKVRKDFFKVNGDIFLDEMRKSYAPKRKDKAREVTAKLYKI